MTDSLQDPAEEAWQDPAEEAVAAALRLAARAAFGPPDGPPLVSDVDDMARGIAAFIRALPEWIPACRSHVEIAAMVEDAAKASG
jgi:hypothetical protein